MEIYQAWRGLASPEEIQIIEQPFDADGSGKEPRYYQRAAINLLRPSPKASSGCSLSSRVAS